MVLHPRRSADISIHEHPHTLHLYYTSSLKVTPQAIFLDLQIYSEPSTIQIFIPWSLLQIIHILNMLFAAKTGMGSHSRSKTPNKSGLGPTSTTKKDNSRFDTGQKDKKDKSGKENMGLKYRTKDSYLILQNLEEIYHELNFNEFDVFPLENIEKAKKNIQNLLTFLGDQPTCRYHRDLLNLYCDTDKTVICVSCVYKAGEHKSHKVKSIESVQKVLDLETIRSEEKTKGLIHQLNELKDQIDYMTKEIGENYLMISKFTIGIIDESIKELNAMKADMEKKLSLAYRRTTTVINRYNEALDLIVNHLDSSVQKTVLMNPLSKHLLLKELTFENEIIQVLINKFNQNRLLMEQWRKSNQEFEKIIVRKSQSINTKTDTFVVTQF